MRSFIRATAVVLVVCAGLHSNDAHGQRMVRIQQADRIPDVFDHTSKRIIPGHVPHWVSMSTDIGPAASSEPMTHLVISLKRDEEVERAFQQMLRDQHDPSSSRYQQWLSPTEVGELFGPTQHDVDAVTRWLTSQGLVVESVSPSHIAVTFSGTIANVQMAFATSVHKFKLVNGQTLTSIVQDPSVPTAVEPVVAGITGLAESRARVYSKAVPLVSTTTSSDVSRPYVLYNYQDYITSADFTNIYGLSPLATDKITGKNQNAAVIIDSRVNLADLVGGASRTTVIVPSTTSDPGITGDGEQVEATLDAERILETATGSHVDLVAGKDLSTTTIMNLLQYAVGTLNDPIINMSFGTCERDIGKAATLSFDSAFAVAAAQGIGIYVASGDAGAADCDVQGAVAPVTQVLSTNFLCSSQWVTCVGGTSFLGNNYDGVHWPGAPVSSDGLHIVPNYSTPAYEYIPEAAWNEPGYTTFTVNGGGGGASQYITKPSWQTGVGVPNDGARDTPDISFHASAANGYLLYMLSQSSSPLIVSGTSASSPSMAGIALLINEKTGKRLGNLNSKLYGAAASKFASYIFHDISLNTMGLTSCDLSTPTMCNNSTPGQFNLKGGLQGYAVSTGFDQATGLGSLDGYGFGQYLTSGTANSMIALTGTRNIVTAYFPSSLVTAPSGYIQFYVNGLPWQLPQPITSNKMLINGALLYGVSIGLFSNDFNAFRFPSTTNVFGTTYIDVNAYYYGDAIYGATATDKATYAAGTSFFNMDLSAKSTPITTLGTTLVVTISGNGSGFPTGSFEFHATLSGADTVLGTIPATAAVSYQILLPNVYLPVGSTKLYVKYLGDPLYLPGVSPVIALTASASPSSLAIAPSKTTFDPGIPTPVTATLTSTAGAGPAPTGAVTLLDGAAVVGTSTSWVPSASNTTFTATVPVTLNGAAGTRSLTASFASDTTYLGSTSKSVNVTLSNAPTVTLTLKAAATTALIGTDDVLTAVLTPSNTSLTPTGTITFIDGATSLGTVSSLTAGGGVYTAGLTANFKTTGIHGITASYSGGSGYTAATSSSLTVTVNNPTATITLKAASMAVLTGVNDDLALTFVPDNTTIVPTGNVTFLDGTTVLGSTSLIPSGGSYIASYNAVFTTAGVHSLTAQFGGGAGYASMTSAPVLITVSLMPQVMLTADKASLILTSGANTGNTAAITLVGTNGLTGAVSLNCTMIPSGTAPSSPATCTMSPSSITLTAGGTATSTASVASITPHVNAAAVGTVLRPRVLPTMAIFVPLIVIARRRRYALRLFLLFITAMAVNGCGGASGSGGSGTGGGTTTLTSVGAYTMTITAAASNGSTQVSSTLSIPVTIN